MANTLLQGCLLGVFGLGVPTPLRPDYTASMERRMPLAWVSGGFIDIWPVKPFETVMGIKGYTNRIELNYTET